MLVTDETIRRWSRTFGQTDAHTLLRRPYPGDTWHLDAVDVAIACVPHYRWRAVDRDGAVLNLPIQRRRNTQAAKQFCRRWRKDRASVPRVLLTATLARHGAARRAVLPGVEHRRRKGPNNRAENSHQPTRERERRMRRFKAPGHAQRLRAATA